MKRKRQEGRASQPEKKQKILEEPIHGPRPIVNQFLCFAEKCLPCKVLLDTGATGPVLSAVFVDSFEVPKVKRDVPARVFGFTGDVMKGTGHAFTQPLIIMSRGHQTQLSFEIAPLPVGIDAILPNWWLKEHKPVIRSNGEVSYDGENCKSRCFTDKEPQIEMDEGVLDDPEAQFIGSICLLEDESVNLRETLPSWLHGFLKVFLPSEADKLPPHRSYDHAIDLEPGKQPPWGPVYSLSKVELKVLREYLDKMLRLGKIRPSKSPAGAPILFVKKKDGSLRLCVDYRGLNRVSIKNRYPLPLMDELRDRVAGAVIVSKIDLKEGYNLIRIKDGDEWKTAFRTRYGHFEYLVMPFGLANAPATFQNMMNDALREFLDQGVVVYLDDILIYSKSREEHRELVGKVLSRLQEYNLVANPKKSFFELIEIEFLGYILAPAGVTMALDKVMSVTNWQAPRSVKEVQIFMGFANFYRRFIHNFSGVCKPITDCLRGDAKNFVWSMMAQAAFEKLKTLFTSAPILVHFSPDRQTIVETDASDFAIAAILSQVIDGKTHPVAFYSRKLNPAELNYDVWDKEMLGIVSAFKQWRHYLEGPSRTVLVYTDHKNLEYFSTTKVLNRRQARWAESLAEFDFKIIYRPGTKNGKADALSRRPEYRPEGGGTLGKQPIDKFFKPGQLAEEEFVVSAVSLASKGVIDWSKNFLDHVRQAASGDPTWVGLKERVEQGEKLGEMKDIAEKDGLLFYKNRLYIPADDRIKIRIAQAEHDSKVAGHFGQDKTLELITRNFYWPKMNEWIDDYVRSCDECQRNKPSRHKKYGALLPLSTPHSVWQSISMDFVVQLPESKGYNQIWVVVDRFSKMSHFIPLVAETTAQDLAKIFLGQIWRLHGLPLDIVSDRDAKFTSSFWASLMELLDVRIRMSTAFHPQTDGQTERVNQTLEHYLRAFCNYEQDDWAELLPLAEYAYNNSVTTATGQSPFYTNYGYNPRTNWPTEAEVVNPTSDLYAHFIRGVHDSALARLTDTREKMGKYYDRKRDEPPNFKVGDLVMLNATNIKTRRSTKKLDYKKLGPFKIIRLAGKRACELELPPQVKIHNVFHIELLERYRQSSIPGREQRPPTPEEVDKEGEVLYEVESIVGSRKSRRGLVEYLVKWRGYSMSDCTYQVMDAMDEEVLDLVRDFHRRNPKAVKDQRLRL
ncbi:uncharacterized protein H6S33_011413 [Morchella sextelata]|uniref:uncharacterized protein n=1 Tax=Morchella sextelata TaxID=1174677 RepID=UPI001D037DB7|nr:uncharacterized protein H6S33_011413 [Morchella sextelata]KAH0610986.1 hypothetical protein H6S33_011413 [Morchella sextelata]